MNKVKNIFVLFFIGVIILCMFSCSQQSVLLDDKQYNFSVIGVYFENQQLKYYNGGIMYTSNSWDHYKSIGVNKYYCEADTDPHVCGEPVVIARNIALNYDSTNTPYVDIKEEADYTIEGNGTWYDSSTVKFTTNFIDSTGDIIETVIDRQTIRNKTDNNIVLTYWTSSESVVDISVSKSEKGCWGWVDGALKYSNIDCYDIHEASHDNGSKDGNINIIVMAEGYRADQIYKFKEYANDAFADTANFHYRAERDKHNHVTSDFFDKYWDIINVIRMDTISSHEGIDNDWTVDRIQSILNLNSDKRSGLSRGDYSRIRTIIDNNKPKGMSYTEVDAVIIFVNDPTIWAYSGCYDAEIGLRNYQPINVVVIQAPIKDRFGFYNDVTAPEFHTKRDASGNKISGAVLTDCIVHELGHALARLQDEYLADDLSIEYKTHYRNIDNDTDFKWQWFIDNGYNTPGVTGALYKSWYYRPSETSTMIRHGLNVQFNAVCTYHLTATFKVRMMNKYSSYDIMREPKQEWEYYNPFFFSSTENYDDESCYFEWNGYKYSEFLEEWPPLTGVF